MKPNINVNSSTHLKQPIQLPTLYIGVDLGNQTTKISLCQKHFQYETVMTLTQDKCYIGSNGSEFKELNNSNGKSKNFPNIVVIRDFLDLYISKLQNVQKTTNNKEYYENKLMDCFYFYSNDFFEDYDSDDMAINLPFQNKLINRESSCNNEELSADKNSLLSFEQKSFILLSECILLFLKECLLDVISKSIGTIEQVFQHYSKIVLVFSKYGFENNSLLTSLSNVSKFLKDVPVECRFRNNCISISSYYLEKTCRQIDSEEGKKGERNSNNHQQQSNQLITPSKSKHLGQESFCIPVIQFGSRGFSFGIFKLYPKQFTIECLQTFQKQFGGVHITRLMTTLISEDVKRHQGVNITTTKSMVDILYDLAQEAKIVLSRQKSKDVYIRVDSYPLQEPYGFYLKPKDLQRIIKGEISQIQQNIAEIINRCNKDKRNTFTDKVILSGGSVSLSYFQSQIVQKLFSGKQIIYASSDWVSKGSVLNSSTNLITLEKSNLSLSAKGDDDYEELIIARNEDLPFRFYRELEFPRGELVFLLRLMQSGKEVVRYEIESSFLSWNEKLNFFIEAEEDKPLAVYSTKKMGKIYFKGENHMQAVKLNDKQYELRVIPKNTS